ncbi:MAG: hypothetical protein HRU26_05705 [Psychroserpens sp.]|nr:hypothetical protein [Psychroserpens sp.]
MKPKLDGSSYLHILFGFLIFISTALFLNIAFNVEWYESQLWGLGAVIILSIFKEVNDFTRKIKWLLTSNSKPYFDFWDIFWSIIIPLTFVAIKYQ